MLAGAFTISGFYESLRVITPVHDKIFRRQQALEPVGGAVSRRAEPRRSTNIRRAAVWLSKKSYSRQYIRRCMYLRGEVVNWFHSIHLAYRSIITHVLLVEVATVA